MKAVQILMMGQKKAEGLGYGYLYNWYAVSNANFAPTGWHVPTKTEMDTLIDYMITNGYNYDDTIINNKIGKALSTASEWKASTISGGVGNIDYPAKRNVSGFSVRPVGIRPYNFMYKGEQSIFWVKDNYSDSRGINKIIRYNYIDFSESNYYKYSGLSIRLIKDNSINSLTMTDYDNNVYNTIKIGTQVWTIQNWKCTKLNDGTAIPKVTDATSWTALTTPGMCAYDNDETNV